MGGVDRELVDRSGREASVSVGWRKSGAGSKVRRGKDIGKQIVGKETFSFSGSKPGIVLQCMGCTPCKIVSVASKMSVETIDEGVLTDQDLDQCVWGDGRGHAISPVLQSACFSQVDARCDVQGIRIFV